MKSNGEEDRRAPSIEVVTSANVRVDGLIVVDRNGAPWLTHAAPWWSVVAWLRWWLMPGEKAWMLLRCGLVRRVRVRVVRLSESPLVRIG